MTQYTPMIQQYLAVKAQVPDAFLFFRLGDFYELFFEDAINATRELGITLTGRGGGTEEKIPMCGVPYHAAEGYIARLVEKGYKVAICEQVENPAEAKGVVRREIVRIVTPGTVMDSKLLGEKTNNYIVAVVSNGDESALAACDISTGELYVTTLIGGTSSIMDEWNVYDPSETIASGALIEELRSSLALGMKPAVFTPWEQEDEALLNEHFGDSIAELQSLPAHGKRCVSMMLTYLHETQKRALTHVKQIRRYEAAQYMTMDPFTRRNLELLETVRERSKKGSLLWMLDNTVTAMGARTLRRWIEKPLMSKVLIDERLEAVERLHGNLIARDDVRTALKEVYDLERLVARISYGNANARDLIALKVSIAQVPGLQEACLASNSTTLAGLANQMDPCADILEWIDQALVEDPPVSVRDGGMIKQGYDAYLDKLREASAGGKQWIAELERKEREATGIKSLKVGFNKVFGYFIEVTKANANALPEGRYERKQTLANAERYITPELKEQEALILEAQDKMVDLELELFTALRERISAQMSRLQRLAERIASVDVLQGFAHVSASNRYTKPNVTTGYHFQVKAGRHPVVEAVTEGKTFIDNATDLSEESSRMLLITGPNMAGKSTYMRQVAVISIMAQIGCYVPADEATIPIIDRIFTRIGAADDLIGGQSTFMVEMMDIQVMTEKATARSLVIIDELGRGTSTGEGMAIAQAVIEHLHNHTGCKTLVSTHFHELAHLEEGLQFLRNYCMAVKESDSGVTFLRKLIPGAASTSYGIYCAEVAGLPQGIISRSYELLSAFEARAGSLEAAAALVGGEVAATASAAVAVGTAAFTAQPQEQAASHSTPPATPPAAADRSAAERIAEPAVQQLSLFEDAASEAASEAAPLPEAAANEAAVGSAVDAKQRDVLDALKAIDLINMTPLQAMNLLYELKTKIG
ncbi:DNA mismatch repair protein MutS [Paenibacillus sp. N1-5-1-14]|uniref:DNA mismatch repair protein MutS n=1 Tax=Paenibacillus radicibacter TaxID=2972488 RepID=UPI0021596180|nr:DNA mismatch repair protein MutS [Paenibacillus radicibacter]MCR8641624.1 DNA mismatch repair protein MutS [Paenibacillus radicibacter]